MFKFIFGEHLVSTGKLTSGQYNEIIEMVETSRVKLGMLAEANNMLSKKQADEVNRLQAVVDKRFGDIAISKGYLTEEQVSSLLKLQGNTYFKFIQAIIDREYLSLEDVTDSLSSFQSKNGYSNEQMELFKTDDLDNILPILIQMEEPFYNDLIELVIRNLVRFVTNNIMLSGIKKVNEYGFDYLSNQTVIGDHTIYLGFSGSKDGLLLISNNYAKEEFDELDIDSFDSICEFINCINGLFARYLSDKDVVVDLLPPTYAVDGKLTTNALYVVSLKLCSKPVDIIVSIDQIIKQ